MTLFPIRTLSYVSAASLRARWFAKGWVRKGWREIEGSLHRGSFNRPSHVHRLSIVSLLSFLLFSRARIVDATTKEISSVDFENTTSVSSPTGISQEDNFHRFFFLFFSHDTCGRHHPPRSKNPRHPCKLATARDSIHDHRDTG